MRTRCIRAREARRRTPSQLARAGSKEARIPQGSGPSSLGWSQRSARAHKPSTVARLGRRAAACPGQALENTPPAAWAAGRSLTSCRETTPVLAGRRSRTSADVAQWVERDLARVEATSSRLVIRSMSGVSVRKRGFAGVHVRGHAAGHVQRVAWCTGPFACGHSRHGFHVSRSSRGQGRRAFTSATRVRIPYEIPRPPGTEALGDLAPRERKSAAMIGRRRNP